MAKLYWRVKDENTGRWKWVAAGKHNSEIQMGNLKFMNLEYTGDSR